MDSLMKPLATVPPARRGRDRAREFPRACRERLQRGLAAIAPASHGGQRAGADPLLTAAEVAALLQVTKAWVYAETRAKRIPHVPLGRYVRYRRSAVVQWIAALERQASSGVRVPLDEE
jgi:excisionase family DNA binding protein